MPKVRLTTKRLKALDVALSMDDVLYAKFQRLNDEFYKNVRRWHLKNQVIHVIKIGNKYKEDLQIKKEIKTDNGIIVEVC